jgi:hypothetical protein
VALDRLTEVSVGSLRSNKEAIMARKKKEPEVEEVVKGPKAKTTEKKTTKVETRMSNVVHANVNMISVLDMKSLLNAGLNENTVIRVIDTNDMYAPTKVGSVCKIMTQLEADGDIVKLAIT